MVLLIWIIAIGLVVALIYGMAAMADFVSLKMEQNKDKTMMEAIKQRYRNMTCDEMTEIYNILDIACNTMDEYEGRIKTYGFDSNSKTSTYALIDSMMIDKELDKINERYGWYGEESLYTEKKAAANGAFENRYVLSYLLYGKCQYRFHYK